MISVQLHICFNKYGIFDATLEEFLNRNEKYGGEVSGRSAVVSIPTEVFTGIRLLISTADQPKNLPIFLIRNPPTGHLRIIHMQNIDGALRRYFNKLYYYFVLSNSMN